MNEQLQQALTALITNSMKAVEAGATFLQAELPDVIHQLLLWKAVEAGVWAVAQMLIAVALAYVVCQAHKWIANDFGDRNIAYLPCIFLGGCTLVLLSMGFHNATTLIQILVAPKVYLIEYAASLAK